MAKQHAIVRLRLAGIARVLGEAVDVVWGRSLESEADQSERVVTMGTRSDNRLNGPNRPKCVTRPLLAMVLATTATSLAIHGSATAVSQDGLQIRNVASENANPNRADEPEFLVRAARVPIFVDIDLGAAGGTPAVPDDAVDRVVAALDANPRRLITLRFKGGALRFSDLARSTRETLLEKRGNEVISAYNGYMAGQVRRLIGDVDAARAAVPIAVQGIPFEGGSIEVASSNHAYRPVIDRLDAIVVSGGMMFSGSSDQVGMLRRSYPQAVAASGSRAILFAANGGWRIATASVSSSELAEIHAAVDEGEGSLRADVPSPREGEIDSSVLATPGSTDLGRPTVVAGEGSIPSPGAGGDSVDGSNFPSRPIGGGSAGRGGSAIGVGGSGEPGAVESGQAGSLADDPEGSAGHSQAESNSAGDEAAGDQWGSEDEVLAGEDTPGEGSYEAGSGDQADDQAAGDENPSGDSSDDEPTDPSAGDFSSDDEGEPSGEIGSILDGTIPWGSLPEGPVGDPSDPGYDCKAIARWDVVPWQLFLPDQGDQYFGIVAHHRSGIDAVYFALDGGPAIRVSQAFENPQTGVIEYCIRIPVSQLAPGSHEVRAYVVPIHGEPREFSESRDGENRGIGEHSMQFFVAEQQWSPLEVFVSPGGSDDEGLGTRESPFATIRHALWSGLAAGETNADVSGMRIVLMEGQHGWQPTSWPVSSLRIDNAWLEIMGDVEAEAGAVRMSVPNLKESYLSRIRFSGLCFSILPGGGTFWMEGGSGNAIWMDRCHIDGQLDLRATVRGFDDGRWSTECTAIDVRSKPFGSTLTRNCHVDGVIEDAFGGEVAVISSSVRRLSRNIHPLGVAMDFHCDVWQGFNAGGDVENIVLQGLAAIELVEAQGLFFAGQTSTFRDIAIVNVAIDNTAALGTEPNHYLCLTVAEDCSHLLISDSVLRGGILKEYGFNEWGQMGDIWLEDVLFSDVRQFESDAPMVPWPDGPSAGWPGYWPGVMPWTSPISNVTYRE